MATFKPETLRNPLFPTFFICRFLGIGIIESPVGVPRRILGLIYPSIVFISYTIVFFIYYDAFSTFAEQHSSPVADFAFYGFYFSHFTRIIYNIVNCMVDYEEHNYCLMELMSINVAIDTMRVSSSYEFILRRQIWQFLFCLFIISGTIIFDYIYLIPRSSEIIAILHAICYWYILHYPILISTFGDMTYSMFNREITRSFKDLNSVLKSLRIKHPDEHTRMGTLIRIDVILKDKEKLEKLRCIRKIHLRLYNLAERWTDLNGLHVISSTGIAIWTGTFVAYNIYCIYMNISFPEKNVYFPRCLQTIILHYVKLYMIGHTTTELRAQERQTGEILLQHLWPIEFLRLEVNDFALQLNQNPLRLYACGLFNLDYSLMQMVIRNIVTYLFVLVQTTVTAGNVVDPSTFPPPDQLEEN